MQQVELTMTRSLKVFWSFIWRTWVFIIPVSIAIVILTALAIFLTGGFTAMRTGKMDPNSLGGMGLGLMALVYLVFIPAMFAVQTYAMKLALGVRWSDFRLVAVTSTGSVVDDAHSVPAAPAAPSKEQN